MKRNNIQAINLALELAMKKHDNMIVYGQDVGYSGGVLRTTKGLQNKFGEKRIFDAPISEAIIAGSAVGAAINGLRPVIEMQSLGFTYPAFQQLLLHAARMRNRSRGKYTVPLVLRTTGSLWNNGANGALEHHAEAIESLYAHIPGLKVVMTSKPNDTKKLLLSAIEDNDPVIFIETVGSYFDTYKSNEYTYDVPEEVSDDYEITELGKAKLIKSYQVEEKPDLTIVTYGSKVYDSEYAANELEKEGYKIELIDLQTIQPWDEETVIASVKKTGRLLVVQEAVKSFSVGAEILATVNEKAFDYLRSPSARIAGYDVTLPLSRGEKWFIIDPSKIMTKAKELINHKK